MKLKISFSFLLSIWIISGAFAKKVCYGELGCFDTGYPWTSITRMFPAPSSPEDINTIFYYTNRKQTQKVEVSTRPKIGKDFYVKNKETVIITHGLNSDSHNNWMKKLTEAFLSRNDYNIYLVDWKKGSYENYFQAASNTRVVAAEITRLIRHLMGTHSANPSTFYLLGHSLGAHVMAYVGKSIPGIKRITALDPAKPGFQKKDAKVRLHHSDAKFVDVIHTYAGFGMTESVGVVDFFVNGGGPQPGCKLTKNKKRKESILENLKESEKMVIKFALCSHARSAFYMAIAIKGVCKMWGHPYDSTVSHRNYEKYVSNEQCSHENCTVMGLETPNYPARGNFIVRTTEHEPFCVPEKTID